MVDVLAIPVVVGRKTARERFAGATNTMTLEGMMGDGKALQMGTSHELGQNFARVFGTQYSSESGALEYVWQTSWGVSTRLIGAVVMAHGDDYGLRLPPRIAPVQAVIVPIFFGSGKEIVRQKAEAVAEQLKGAGIRIEADLREVYTPGWKFNFWELKGVPLRIEIGPRDIQQEKVVVVRRDTREKINVPETELVEKLKWLLNDYQDALRNRSKAFVKENTHHIDEYEEFKRVIDEKRGFIVSPWCGNSACEEKIKDETKATIRCIPLDEEREPQGKRCIVCDTMAKWCVYFARAY
ncbi:MAG: His/Gly/Thr/Pro-type tRNA ligase C-terminal domain-containing protein [Candidatus Sumerlaeia bacterium]|nr:His/Gly/Thr/Pro-type tRNA ligase C-terminal domain-containing protein [Candidatus Sumerlaeia bacterium]